MRPKPLQQRETDKERHTESMQKKKKTDIKAKETVWVNMAPIAK